MAAEIIQIDNQDLTTQIYSGQDTNLISSFDINTDLTSGSYIEYFTYDLNQNLLSTDYNFTQYSVTNDGQSAGSDNVLSQITLNPEQSLIDSGFDQGSYVTYYNFLNKQIGSSIEQLYIAEISSDRTEIRLDSTVLSDLDIVESTNQFIQERTDSIYFLDFYLNFGDNQLIIANNIELDSQDPTNSTVLVKLYEPLPFDFDLNSILWVVTSIEEPIAYQVNFEDEPIVIQDTTPISGPNFNLDIKGQVNNSTLELSYADLVLTSVTSSKNQLNSLLEEKEIDINIDYTNFADFIHFSSAQTRLENFYYKLGLIEQYSSSIAILNNTNSSSIAVGETSTVLENKIDSIITNFDGYDYYLYYSSGSSAWPKTNTEPPYQLATVNSVAGLDWFGSTNEYSPYFGGIINSASLFDNSNKDYLYYTIPEYLRDDSDNNQYKLFIDMVAQHFDNIWIYYKDVTQKYNADNRLESGISKDIVADAIRDFGIKLYQNNFSNDDLYTAFLGLTPEGGLFPFPNITGSLPTPSGFEYVNTLISASNDYLPLDDVNKSLYKRIYHNLPYLLKSKGTLPGLRALITSYGIPDTILRINEYGGKDKVEGNDWDYWQNEFNYAFKTEGNNFISSSWNSINSSWNSPDTTPSTLAFRFKTNGLPSTNIPYSQSLWRKGNDVHLVLRYTGSGYTSGSYSGSIANPYNQYALLDFYPNHTTSPNQSSSLYLPFFDGGWWSVMINRDNGTSNFTLSAANKIYEGGNNGTLLGFYSTSSITASTDADWYLNGDSYFASSSIVSGSTYRQFSGSIQEIRYYNTKLSEESFKDFTMNPYSVEGNSLNSGPNELIFRASLGGELYTGSVSIHPKVTGSWVPTSSFTSNSNFNFNTTPTFVSNEEYFFYDQPAVGIRNAVSDKIRLEDNVMPSGDTLSPFRRLTQQSEVSASYTPNTNLLEVAFSPQDEINDDINSSIGYFNIGDFIGDPAFRSNQSTSYPDLDAIRNAYFEKYTKNYDLTDFIRLIKFFDNSLFKMIQNFVPARTSLAAGIVIKQHLLERNRYPQPQMSWSDLDISGTLKPQWNDYEPGTVEHFEGGTAGSLEQYNYVSNTSQSWYETYPTISGSVTIFHDNQDEFYNGEFSGSVILVTTQSLNQAYPLENASFNYTPILYKSTNFGQSITSNFASSQVINSLTIPYSGEMMISINRKKPTIGASLIGVDYIKISKIDFNGNNLSTPLGQITNLLIKYTTNSTYVDYKVNNITELSTCYLYDIEVNTQYSDTDTEIKNYYVSSSITSSSIIPSIISPITSWGVTLGNTSHYGTPYFNTSSGYYTLGNTPNISIQFTSSIRTSGSSTGIFGYLYSPGDGSASTLNYITFNSGSNVLSTISSSFNFKQGDILIPIYNAASSTLKSGSLLITQSVSPTASIQDPIILEPYITTVNYYNSDNNPLINNATEDRKSDIYQDIDYTQGALVPVNFNLLIEGDATKAAVQDSNYTTKRHTIPRYEGSKSTSQHLNYWTLGDEGTYGKTPTIESLKTAVAYCDWIGGNTPDQMGTSLAHIKYLINADGTVSIPNTSENSLYINQGNFQTGERFKLSSTTVGSQITPYRTIVRGASRISPILYTQLGHTPAAWTSSINLINNNIQSTITDITALSNMYALPVFNPTAQFITTASERVGDSSNIGESATDGWAISYDAGNYRQGTGEYFYLVTSDAITQGINIVINANIQIYNQSWDPRTVRVILKRYRFGTETSLQTQDILLSGYEEKGALFYNISLIPQVDIIAYDQLYFTIQNLTPIPESGGSVQVMQPGTYFNTLQNPLPNPLQPVTVATGSIWNYPTSSTYNQASSSNAGIIYVPLTSSVLNVYYDTEGVRQQSISGSGFFDIELDWNVNVGDEFRFEGREDRTFMVNKVFPPTDVSSERISQTGSLEIHLNNPIPSASINLDHFVIRRYIDDASGVIFEGFKPNGSTGPYILSPEFVVPALNKSLDQFILDLTQKGLL
jgi:hypothetical protein